MFLLHTHPHFMQRPSFQQWDTSLMSICHVEAFIWPVLIQWGCWVWSSLITLLITFTFSLNFLYFRNPSKTVWDWIMMWGFDWIIVRCHVCMHVCVCARVCLFDPSECFIKQSIIFRLCCRIEMQFLSLVFELPTRPVLMATDGPRSSVNSLCSLLMYAALLKHYSVFYDLANTGGKFVHL